MKHILIAQKEANYIPVSSSVPQQPPTHTLYFWKCLTPLMWALHHGAYPVVEEHVDPVAAAHCIVAVMPFPVLSCFLSLCCPLWVAAFEGQSFHQKFQVRMGRIQRGMWINVGDPCSSRKYMRQCQIMVQVAKCFPGWDNLTSHTDLKRRAVLVTGGGCGCGPIFSAAWTQLRLRNALKHQIHMTHSNPPYLLSSGSSSMKPDSQCGQV